MHTYPNIQSYFSGKQNIKKYKQVLFYIFDLFFQAESPLFRLY